jgi:hypothetical protein
MDEMNMPTMPAKQQKKSNGVVWIILIVLVLIIGLVYIVIHNKDKNKDVAFIESLKFVNINEAPNQTLVENCNALYNNTKPQTYFNLMYDCVGHEILEKVVVTIPRGNITKDLLDSQCECLRGRTEDCKVYKCGEAKVWGKI